MTMADIPSSPGLRLLLKKERGNDLVRSSSSISVRRDSSFSCSSDSEFLREIETSFVSDIVWPHSKEVKSEVMANDILKDVSEPNVLDGYLRQDIVRKDELENIDNLTASSDLIHDNPIENSEINHERKIINFCIFYRLMLFFIGLITTFIVSDFDYSGRIALDLYENSNLSSVDYNVRRIFLHYIRWDALYFLDISNHGYTIEKEHAFFPLLPIVSRILANIFYLFFGNFVNLRTCIFVSGILISNASFVLAAVILYRLSLKILKNEDMAFRSALMFSIQPASIFMSSFYSESLFSLLSFSGMLFYANNNHLTASILFGVSTLARSNGLIYSGFFFYWLLKSFMRSRSPLCVSIFKSILTIFFVLISISGFLMFQFYGYREFCPSSRSWCNREIPLLYSYVQEHYWNNGFLRYYELKQLPNFLLAAPMITLTLYTLVDFIKEFNSFWDLFFDDRFPFVVYTSFLLIYGCLMMHVQVITRMFSSVPLVFWYAAKNRSPVIINYFIWYSIINTVLFSAFYPPA